MADLMSSHKSSFVSLTRGQSVKGVITKLTSSEILVDIGAKTEAVVLEKDKNILHSLMSALKVGDNVEVGVLSPESEFGYPVVSLRHFIDNKIWKTIDETAAKKEIMDVNVDEYTKGGFVVSTETGISGFLPNSHMVLADSSASMVGKKIKATILEVDHEQKKVIFSQKTTLTRKDFEDALANIKTGDIVEGVLINSAPFGLFISLQSATQTPLEGFIHQSEVSWESTDTGKFKPGDKIKAKVLGQDFENKRINLSIKRLSADPFEKVMSEFTPDKKVTAVILKVASSGITLDLGNGIEGIIKKEKIAPNSSFEKGQKISATVVDVDSNRHRVTLVPVLLEKPMGYR